MSAREAIFSRIGKALGPARPAAAIAAEAARLLDQPQRVRPALPDGDPPSLFLEAVKRLPPGASAERLAALSEVPAVVARHLAEAGLPPRLKVQSPLASLPWPAAGLQPDDTVDDAVAVSLAEWGVAETASLLFRSSPEMAILDAILPLHHIAVLREETILRHLDDVAARMDLARSRNVILVTGPSGTTDIEGNLVIGVHGPGTLHILIVP